MHVHTHTHTFGPKLIRPHTHAHVRMHTHTYARTSPHWKNHATQNLPTLLGLKGLRHQRQQQQQQQEPACGNNRAGGGERSFTDCFTKWHTNERDGTESRGLELDSFHSCTDRNLADLVPCHPAGVILSWYGVSSSSFAR